MPFAPSRVALTYANDLCHDELSVQLQKIYSIYALSRFLDFSYVHSPIKSINNNAASLEAMVNTHELIKRCNQIFRIKSDVELPSRTIIHTLATGDLGCLCNLKDSAKNSDDFHLIKIISPSPVIDTHPAMLHYVKKVSPFSALLSPPFRIALHLEQGDLSLSQQKFLNAHYISTAQKIIKLLQELDIPFVCELLTDFSPHDGLSELDALPNLKKMIQVDPVYSLQSLATADLLIMNHSPMSYVAAFLNKIGVIVSHPNVKHPLSTWLQTTNSALFHDQITRSFLSWKKRFPL